MKKLLAVVAVLAPVVALLPATPASADVVCVPITVDGQPIFCTDAQPVTDAVAEVEAAAAGAEAALLGVGSFAIDEAEAAARDVTGAVTVCPRIEPEPGGVNVYVAASYDEFNGYDDCIGYKVSIVTRTAGLPVHVPQVCLTTTGTCVGPVDQTIPGPDQTQSPVEICAVPVLWYRPSGSTDPWTNDPIIGDPLWPTPGCVDMPFLP